MFPVSFFSYQGSSGGPRKRLVAQKTVDPGFELPMQFIDEFWNQFQREVIHEVDMTRARETPVDSV
jgi:hypothetical protein